MAAGALTAWMLLAAHIALTTAFAARALLRPHREPASRLAWMLVLVLAPFVGVLAYVLFGEVKISPDIFRRITAAEKRLPDAASVGAAARIDPADAAPKPYDELFRVGRSISGFEPVDGNRALLLADSDAAIDALVADIDAARDHVHLLFYIWLPDGNGGKVAAALARAAARGVACRAMVDDLGSRALTKSDLWQMMDAAGVRLARAFPIGNPILRPLRGRIDLRNHRKIVVIDNAITYCGSQNCADPAFRVKPKYAPWVDAMVRFEGPVARQNQHLFAIDWMSHVEDDLGPLLRAPLPVVGPGLAAQVIGTGPTVRNSAMPEMFVALMHAARNELVVTTPYYVPDETLQSALCASGRRGVDTTVIFPERNDSRIVAAASRSYYAELIDAGVVIYEYRGGLLHTKSLTLDGQITLIGSANIDRRSFDLNYENNILFCDRALTAAMRDRQASYIAASRRVSAGEVAAWSWRRRLWDNAVAMLGPVL